MPIIKSAKKKAKQSDQRKARLKPFKTRMLTMFKNIFKWAADGSPEKMCEQASATCKAIDMAAKKNIIHPNNAARKKSAVQLAVNKALKESPEAATKTSEKKAPAKKAAAPKKPVAAKASASKKASIAKKTATKKAAK